MPTFVIAFPSIDPILFEIGPIAIRWYALAYVFGLLFGWWYARRIVMNERLWNGRAHPSVSEVDDLLVWIAVGIIVGGRLGYVLFYNLEVYLDDPLAILEVWTGGMSFHGGLAGAALATWIVSRRRGINPWTALDIVAVVVPIGLFLGRVANFVNGELYGRPTDLPWAMVFPQAPTPEPRHPSQLYEALLEGIVLFALLAWLVWRRKLLTRPGMLTGTFLVFYGTARFFVEFVRSPDQQVGDEGYFLGFLTMGMILSLPLAALGLWVLTRSSAAPPPDPTEALPEAAPAEAVDGAAEEEGAPPAGPAS